MLYTPSVIAVLYGVHGNVAALDAVLEDARGVGAEQWILGGDYALFGPWPAEAVARLRGLEPAVWVRGNVDRWVGDPAAGPDDAGIQEAIADCRGALGDTIAHELGALPFEAELEGARIVHASPVSDLRSFAPEPDPEDEELLDGTTQPRLLFGHTHIQFRRQAGSVELVNPGSVGMPLDGDPRAAYALIRPDGALELRRVGYDTGAAIARLREAFGERDWVEMISGRLERSRP
jgi:predicted phosphodiesterase